MFENFDDEGRRIVIRAHDRAKEVGHDRVGADHLLLALMRDWPDASRIFAEAGLPPPERIAQVVEGHCSTPPPAAPGENPVITRDLKAWLDSAVEVSSSHGQLVRPAHLLLAGIENFDQLLSLAGVSTLRLRDAIQEYLLVERPEPKEDACPTCGALTRDFGQVRQMKMEVEGGTAIAFYAYFCRRCGSTYGLVRSPVE